MRCLIVFCMVFCSALSASELRHYDVLVFPYNDLVYTKREVALTHDSYKLYELTASLADFPRPNGARAPGITIHVVFFNNPRYDTSDRWVAETRGIVAINQKHGNDTVIFDEGRLGEATRYVAVANEMRDDPEGGHIEYKLCYIKRDRMVTMQVVYHGDTDDDAALAAFLTMANAALAGISDAGVKPFSSPLGLAADWRAKIGPAK